MNAPPILFDVAAVRRHRERAAARVGRVEAVLRDTAERLLDRLDDTTRRFTAALDLGGRGVVAADLRARGMQVVSADLAGRMAAWQAAGPGGGQAGGKAGGQDGLAVAADAERLPFAPGSFDLVVANLSLHWMNDLPGALIQLRHAMRPDGLLLASMPVLGTLDELRRALTEAEVELTGGAAPRVSPFPELRDCAALLQRAGFALPVADLEPMRLLYADPFELLRDLRDAGESNALASRDRRIPPRLLFPSALSRLPQVEGRAAVTLRLAILTGWAPAPGQPRPLAPGSGRTPLGAALGGGA